MEKVVEKMSHAPAECFQIKERGFIREGYYADLVLVDMKEKNYVSKGNIHYKCNWSPLEGSIFRNTVTHTFVSGHLAYERGIFHEGKKGERGKGKKAILRQIFIYIPTYKINKSVASLQKNI